jgi:hypothetical protein
MHSPTELSLIQNFPIFRRRVLIPSSCPIGYLSCYLLIQYSRFGQSLNSQHLSPEDGGNIFFQKVVTHQQRYQEAAHKTTTDTHCALAVKSYNTYIKNRTLSVTLKDGI